MARSLVNDHQRDNREEQRNDIHHCSKPDIKAERDERVGDSPEHQERNPAARAGDVRGIRDNPPSCRAIKNIKPHPNRADSPARRREPGPCRGVVIRIHAGGKNDPVGKQAKGEGNGDIKRKAQPPGAIPR